MHSRNYSQSQSSQRTFITPKSPVRTVNVKIQDCSQFNTSQRSTSSSSRTSDHEEQNKKSIAVMMIQKKEIRQKKTRLDAEYRASTKVVFSQVRTEETMGVL